jgi:Ankyrin repeats (3 copies)
LGKRKKPHLPNNSMTDIGEEESAPAPLDPRRPKFKAHSMDAVVVRRIVDASANGDVAKLLELAESVADLDLDEPIDLGRDYTPLMLACENVDGVELVRVMVEEMGLDVNNAWVRGARRRGGRAGGSWGADGARAGRRAVGTEADAFARRLQGEERGGGGDSSGRGGESGGGGCTWRGGGRAARGGRGSVYGGLGARAQLVGRTSLHWACIGCPLRTVKSLVRRGGPALVNAADMSGYTSLMVASEHGRPEVVHFLVAAGGDITAANKLGHVSAELADWYGYAKVLDHLDPRWQMAANGAAMRVVGPADVYMSFGAAGATTGKVFRERRIFPGADRKPKPSTASSASRDRDDDADEATAAAASASASASAAASAAPAAPDQ